MDDLNKNISKLYEKSLEIVSCKICVMGLDIQNMDSFINLIISENNVFQQEQGDDITLIKTTNFMKDGRKYILGLIRIDPNEYFKSVRDDIKESSDIIVLILGINENLEQFIKYWRSYFSDVKNNKRINNNFILLYMNV